MIEKHLVFSRSIIDWSLERTYKILGNDHQPLDILKIVILLWRHSRKVDTQLKFFSLTKRKLLLYNELDAKNMIRGKDRKFMFSVYYS